MVRMDLLKSKKLKRRRLFKRIVIPAMLLVLLSGLVLSLRSSPDKSGELEESGTITPETSSNEPNKEDQRIETDGSTENSESGVAEIKLQFAGDIFLHQGPIDVARTGENTYDLKPFFTHIKPFIDGDLAIANMEVPVDARGGNQDVAGFPLFNSPFEILDAVQYAGFTHMITANNHSFDFGLEGILNTINSFERAGLEHTGINASWEDFNKPTILDINGIQVGLIAYTDSVNGLEDLVPEASRAYAVRRFRSHTLEDIPQMEQDMADLKAAGAELVIVSLHWGEEYEDEPLPMQRLIAAELSEAGADVIMGTHSHTVHPVEWHEREDGSRTLIMYSLGNFLADQTRLTEPSVDAQISTSSNNDMGRPFIGRTQFGMLVSLQVTKELNGEIRLGEVEVLPTLCMRDFSGNTLGTTDGVSVMPLVNGELPDFVADEELRKWGREAYNHVVNIVDEQFIVR